VPTVVGR